MPQGGINRVKDFRPSKVIEITNLLVTTDLCHTHSKCFIRGQAPKFLFLKGGDCVEMDMGDMDGISDMRNENCFYHEDRFPWTRKALFLGAHIIASEPNPVGRPF